MRDGPGEAVERYWQQYLSSLGAGHPRPERYKASFFFGFGPADAPGVSKLVLDGTKTATGSVLWAYQADRKPLPEAGDLWIVTNGADDPVCIIETTEVRILPFDEVGEEYARDGGEGDRALAGWREMYWRYMRSECRRIGREPHEKAPLVMERFRVRYREPLRHRGGDGRAR